MGQVKEISIKSRTYFFFHGMINIEVFDPNLQKLTNSHTKTLIFIILDTSKLQKLMIMKIFIV